MTEGSITNLAKQLHEAKHCPKMSNELRFAQPLEATPVLPDQNMALAENIDPALPAGVEAQLIRIEQGGYGDVLVLRGPVGIGKSVLAKKIYKWCLDNNMSCVVCSDDPWFLDRFGFFGWFPGGAEAAEAHAQGRYLLAMASRVKVVVVDMNPFNDHQWYKNFLDTTFYGLQVIEFNCDDPRKAALRTPHLHHWNRFLEASTRYEATREEDAIVVDPTF